MLSKKKIAVAKKTATPKPATSVKASVKVKAKPSLSPSSVLTIGDRAPAFILEDDAGRKVSLADFRGKKLVMYFYPKDNTPGCTQESCDFRDNLNRLASSGAAVVGVSADSVESHRRFKEKQGLNFPLLSDPEKKVLNAYGVWQEKSLYGRKFMGIVRSTFIIDAEGRLVGIFPKVSVKGHVDEVLAALKT